MAEKAMQSIDENETTLKAGDLEQLKKMKLKEIYWMMKQDIQYLVAEGEGYGKKLTITEGQVQKAIKALEKKYRVLVTVKWKPHLYDGVNYILLSNTNYKKIISPDGTIQVETGGLLGNPYAESGEFITILEKLDSEEKMEFVDDYSAAANNLTFLKAIRKTYHLRTGLLKWLGIATEEEDPEIKNIKDKAEQDKKDLEVRERNMLKDSWLKLWTKTDLTDLEKKQLEIIRKYSRAKNEIELEKYLITTDQSVLNITIKKFNEVV